MRWSLLGRPVCGFCAGNNGSRCCYYRSVKSPRPISLTPSSTHSIQFNPYIGVCKHALVRNGIWAPAIKLGATSASQRLHFPVESIYAAIEVKQTLGFRQLDEAMENLVRVSRLNRPLQQYGHITENQHLRFLDKPGFVLNLLRTVVLATGIQKGVSFRDLALRFGNINGRLERDHMISELCALGHGLVWYSTKNADNGFVEATDMWDRDQQLYLSVSDKEPEKVFFQFFVQLLGHLTRSVTWVHNLGIAYGEQHLPPVKHFCGKNALYNLQVG